MRDVHPKYFANATVTCACGETFQTGSTQETIRVDVCSKCHPVYVGGKQRFTSDGRVERFRKKYGLKEA